MKILIISYFFPPYNTIGAVRVSKTAKYLTEFGHDVHVLTALNQPLPENLPLENDLNRVHYSKWQDINALPRLIMGKKKTVNEGFQSNKKTVLWLGSLYKQLSNFPDGQIGWYPYAVKEGERLCKYWKPDLIYASATPYTSLLVAERLSKVIGIPWIAELRDLWTDNHNNDSFKLKNILETRLEAKILSSAAGIVTVSKPLVNTLKRKYSIPIITVLNGYDEDDYLFTTDELQVVHKFLNKDYLNISYTGMIYLGKQDPEPLFRALTKFNFADIPIKINFFGRYLSGLQELTNKMQLNDIVNIHNQISYRQSLCIQANSDVLLLLLWNDPREKGVYTGKIFEYIGAGKPILAIGPKDNVAAQLIIKRGLGIVTENIDEIQRFLADVYKNKGKINMKANSNNDLTRKSQTRKLEQFFNVLMSGRSIKGEL